MHPVGEAPSAAGGASDLAVRGVHLERTRENALAISRLHSHAAARIGLTGLLDDLKWPLRRAPVVPRLLGRAVDRAWTWTPYDRADASWWPQGIATAHDAPDRSLTEGRRVLATTWYAKEVDGIKRGSRITFVDLDHRRYRHVLLVVPTLAPDGSLRLEPLHVHAGGIVWSGSWLHVAATARGFVSAHVDDLFRVGGSDGGPADFGLTPAGLSSYGHRWVLPVRMTHRAVTDEGHQQLRYSFLSLDAASDPPALVAGEYALNTDSSTRIARYALEPQSWELAREQDGVSRPVLLDDGGVIRMQGAAQARGRTYLSTSNGPWLPGTVHVGHPGDFAARRWAMPMGPEDLTYTPATDRLWTVTEHPRRRWIVSMRRSWFD